MMYNHPHTGILISHKRKAIQTHTASWPSPSTSHTFTNQTSGGSKLFGKKFKFQNAKPEFASSFTSY